MTPLCRSKVNHCTSLRLTYGLKLFAVTSAVCSFVAIASTVYRLTVRWGRLWADDVGNCTALDRPTLTPSCRHGRLSLCSRCSARSQLYSSMSLTHVRLHLHCPETPRGQTVHLFTKPRCRRSTGSPPITLWPHLFMLSYGLSHGVLNQHAID